jgi:uncharacterized RDD family membrane protein YckC
MRTFSARETEWLEELDGIELASFWRRAFAFLIDWVIVAVVLSIIVSTVAAGVVGFMHWRGKSVEDLTQMIPQSEGGAIVMVDVRNGGRTKIYRLNEDTKVGKAVKDVIEIVVPVLYFGILLWKGKGRTPGKRLLRIRVVSIVHRHLSFWHSVERALGYGAAALEGGFGFVQFFIHPYRRCAQDRLAETMVVTERGYRAMQTKAEHALLPDTEANAEMPE